jgi:hypothetical protein
MGILLSAIFGSLPNVMLAILSRLVTEKIMQGIIEKIIIYSLGHAVKLTTNTLDDEIAADVIKRLQAGAVSE